MIIQIMVQKQTNLFVWLCNIYCSCSFATFMPVYKKNCFEWESCTCMVDGICNPEVISQAFGRAFEALTCGEKFGNKHHFLLISAILCK